VESESVVWSKNCFKTTEFPYPCPTAGLWQSQDYSVWIKKSHT